MTATEERSHAPWIARRWWIWAIALAAIIPAAGFYGFLLGSRYGEPGTTRLPVMGTAPDYVMENQLGQQVASSSFRGKVQLVTFLFPYCTTMCPLIAAHLTNLENLGLASAGLKNEVEIVSFNVDPAGTGPQQMRAFLREYGWNPGDLHWQYLVASPDEMRRVVTKGFGVWYQKVADSDEAKDGGDGPAIEQPEVVNKLAQEAHATYDIVHNDMLEVVDQKGRIRKVYENADEVSWEDLLQTVQSLVGRRATG